MRARAQATIERPADEVWGRIRDFGDITWISTTRACTFDGTDRIVTVPGINLVITQRLVHHDDVSRTYAYSLVGEIDLQAFMGPGSISRQLDATLAVTPVSDTASTVNWDFDTEEFAVGPTRAEYQTALDALKAEMEQVPRS